VSLGGLPERDAQRKGFELLERRGAMRLAILPVPPRRRIVGSKEDDMMTEEDNCISWIQCSSFDQIRKESI